MVLICRYEGEFVEGKMHGEGTFTWPDGTSYVGQFSNGQMTGEGRCPNVLENDRTRDDDTLRCGIPGKICFTGPSKIKKVQ